MRNITVAILILTLGHVAARAQGGWADSLFKDGTSHDFGSVARGAQLYHRFTIYNRYAVPMTITDIRTSCSCITATPSFKTLGPRESGYVDITMDGRRFSGAKSVRVSITVGPDFVSTAELTIKANSRADVVFNPSQVTFGVVSSGGKPPTQTIEVEYAGNLDWRVTGTSANGAPVDIQLKETYRDRDQKGGFNKVGYKVVVSLKPDAAPGSIKQEIFLQTNDRDTPMVPILIEATVQAALSVIGEGTVRLPDVKVGQKVAGKVYVRGARAFQVTGIEGQGVLPVTQVPTAAEVQQVIRFEVQPTEAGEFRRQLLIKTNMQDAPLMVTVEGKAVP